MANNGDIIVRQGSVRKGRGAISNRARAYQPTRVEWDDGVEGPTPVTECRPVDTRSIISRNSSPDIPFSQFINPYQGCVELF